MVFYRQESYKGCKSGSVNDKICLLHILKAFLSIERLFAQNHFMVRSVLATMIDYILLDPCLCEYPDEYNYIIKFFEKNSLSYYL